MGTQVINATEHRDLPLSMLFESPSNPRRNFDENFLKGMAASMRVQGVLQRLLARPREKGFEIVFGAQRYRAAQMAELPTIPVDIREMSDAEVLEAQLVENLQRRDVHPMEEAQGFKGLLDFGGAEIYRRADRCENGQKSGVCHHPPQTDRPCAQGYRGVLCGRGWRRTCALVGEAAARTAGTGAHRLL